MSRWIEEFNSHPFQKSWDKVREILDDSHIDDETVQTSVEELARLKKAVVFINSIISNIDPELVPKKTWANFDTQAINCATQLENYKSAQDTAHLQSANTHIDNLLTYVRPYMLSETATTTSLTESIENYVNTFESSLEAFTVKAKEKLKILSEAEQEISELSKHVKAKYNLIKDYDQALFDDSDTSESVKTRIGNLETKSQRSFEQISDYHDELFESDEENTSIRSDIANAVKLVKQNAEEVRTLLASISEETKELDTFHLAVFGKTNTDGTIEPGHSQNLDSHIAKLNEFRKEQKIRYEALNTEIESLLPGATNAGLAAAFNELKVSFSTPINRSSQLYYFSIALLFTGSLVFLTSDVGWLYINFRELSDFPSIAKNILSKLPLYIPIVWLAIYATKRRSEYQRLQQEYSHKEALAKSYNSYKKQLSDLGETDEVLMKSFLIKMIDAISFNASSTLDGKHGENSPALGVVQELVESTKGDRA